MCASRASKWGLPPWLASWLAPWLASCLPLPALTWLAPCLPLRALTWLAVLVGIEYPTCHSDCPSVKVTAGLMSLVHVPTPEPGWTVGGGGEGEAWYKGGGGGGGEGGRLTVVPPPRQQQQGGRSECMAGCSREAGVSAGQAVAGRRG